MTCQPQPHPPIGGGEGPDPDGPNPPNFLLGGFGGLKQIIIFILLKLINH